MKFRQRVEAVIEKFEDMREDLDRERKFMGKQWSKREAQILAARLYGRNGGRPAGHRRQGYAQDSSLDMPLLGASTELEAKVA